MFDALKKREPKLIDMELYHRFSRCGSRWSKRMGIIRCFLKSGRKG